MITKHRKCWNIKLYKISIANVKVETGSNNKRTPTLHFHKETGHSGKKIPVKPHQS